MYIMTREKQETDTVKAVYIDNPRFDIDEVRRVKAFIRFNIKSCKKSDSLVMKHDFDTIFKYGRCMGICTIGGALYKLYIRVAGKETDFLYTFETRYEAGGVCLTVTAANPLDKD